MVEEMMMMIEKKNVFHRKVHSLWACCLFFDNVNADSIAVKIQHQTDMRGKKAKNMFLHYCINKKL